MRIGITGSEGQIGTILRAALSDHTLVNFSLKPQRYPAIVADLANADEVRERFEAIEVLIHLAAEPDPLAPWESVLRNNIVALKNVMDEAIRARVRRVVFASTHHVGHGPYMVGGNPGTLDPSILQRTHAAEPAFPDSLYAVSKLMGENLGTLLHLTANLEFIALRIGWVELDENPRQYVGTIHDAYLRSYFLSKRDCAAAFRAALICDEHHLIAYAISNNPGCVVDATAANRRLGFHPQDNIEDFLRG